jgi:hypothetical protein
MKKMVVIPILASSFLSSIDILTIYTMIERRLNAARRDVYRETSRARYALLSSTSAMTNTGGRGHRHDDDSDGDDPAAAADAHRDDVPPPSGSDLGLMLFGTSASYKRDLESEYDDRLRALENELEILRSGLDGLVPPSKNDLDDENDRECGGGEEASSNDDDIDDGSDADANASASIDDIARLRDRVSFLRECADASRLLDDVDDLSFATGLVFASSSPPLPGGSALPMAAMGECDDGGGDPQMSPFSVCDAMDFARFAFDDLSSSSSFGGGKGGTTKTTSESPMVRAARMIRRVEEILDNIIEGLSSSRIVPSGNDDDDCDDKDDGGMDRMQVDMLDELRHRSRRYRMELRHRASTIIETCVEVECSGGEDASDETPGSSYSSISSSGTITVRGIVCESSHSTTTTTTARGVGSVVDIDDTPPSSSPLSDAYTVLGLFSDANFPTFGDTLDGAIDRLSHKLLDTVLLPRLAELIRGLVDEDDDNDNDDDDDVERRMAVGYYKLEKETIRGGGGGGGRSSRGDRGRHDPVIIKGNAVRLRWSAARITSEEDGENDDEGCVGGANDASVRRGGGNVIIATSDAVDGGYPRSILAAADASSTKVAAFLSALNFVYNVLTFVHQNALLCRPDLAGMLGKHLFGVHPVPNVDIASGSAVLGGGTALVGAAAHGLEDGDEMPLMHELVECMRRCCIPRTRSPGAWRMLHKVERRLIHEVSAFEDGLVGMGLLRNSIASDGAIGFVASARGIPESQFASSLSSSSSSASSFAL